MLDAWDGVTAAPEAKPRTSTRMSKPVALSAGQRVPILLEFSANDSATPHLHLVWESRTQDREHIPAAALYPSADATR